jgi:HK97 family phage portal protein
VGFDWDKGYTIDGESVEQTLGGRIIHLRGLAPYDENGFGQGVLQRHAYDLALASQIRDYAVDTLNSGVPHGYLQVTAQNLTKDQAEALKKRWLQEHGNSRSIAVLNATTQFHPLSISPLDAQLIEQKKVSVADIALMFGLDPTFLGAPSGDSATYANVESRQIIFTTHTLTPWARRIEETLSAELPYGTWIEMDMRGLLRGDSNTRKEFYASALEHGWLTVDEVRSIERLPVMPNEPLPAQPQWPGRGPELPAGTVFSDPTVHPEQFTEEKGGGA